jgi:2-polyprenyl-6-methoxyphenol hydroxylase-like FAD-dependent oxidoreductase
MWRGVTRWPPFLTGATMVRAGWFKPGKMVIYPIRNHVDADARQLVNWVAEIETPVHLVRRDWNRGGRIEDFLPAYSDWRFDWLDVPAMIRAADTVLEFPMVDQDPLPRWTFGRTTLLGDAAHPMVPRGSNGAVQAIIDARVLTGRLKASGIGARALEDYERIRRDATTRIVLMNRTNPPDAILREVQERSGDRPFARIDDVISAAELKAITDRYKEVSGAEVDKLRRQPSYV